MRSVSTLNPADRATWPEVLHTVDLAAIYGLSVAKVYRKRRRGELPAELPGSELTWSKADVIDWLDHPRARRGLRRIA